MKSNVHVTPLGKQWQVKIEKSNSPLSIQKTQAKAIEIAKPFAKILKSEVVIHRPNGTIRDKDSYGNDPYPPRDKKH